MPELTPRCRFQKHFKAMVSCSLLAILIALSGFKPALGMDTASVQTIVDKLAKLTGQDFKVVVEDSAKSDAYLHPMGHIVITTGLMNFCEDDAEMAFILGHELAHFLRGHDKEKAEVLGISKDISAPEQLRKEVDADFYGLQYMKAAGYEPAASLRVLHKLIAHDGGQLSPLQTRINALSSSINN